MKHEEWFKTMYVTMVRSSHRMRASLEEMELLRVILAQKTIGYICEFIHTNFRRDRK